MLSESAQPIPLMLKHEFYRKSRAIGKCYVLVETPKHELDDLSDLSVDEIVKVITKFVDLVKTIIKEGKYVYVLWFRNKGKEVGVSLTHPHSQVYVLPFIPVKIRRELDNAKMYWHLRSDCIFCKVLRSEVKDKIRLVYEGEYWIAFIPFFAHWPFEVHIYPKRHVSLITELHGGEIYELANALKIVLCGIKNLFSKPSPYVMVLHQSPIKGKYPYYHLHFEIYGMMRGEDLLKYMGGMELGGGNFTYDSTPEDNAEYLRSKMNKYCLKRVT